MPLPETIHARERSRPPSLGISLRILAGLLGAGVFVRVTAAGPDVPLGKVVFVRSFFVLILFPWWHRDYAALL
ncbi:hypothetical protein So717_40780 [Roseobacter cerasinus]|uniref:EamA/RhaT family transporter n=1 Tax=Roseobacter cerasinus TaxID=2602289 RepID=A0A640VZC2_9RHOB|nr:hypothetical protein So717_40780 [Roseobacter cerasinus]